MWYAHREICSLEKTLVEDYIGEKKNKLCGGQGVRTLEEEHKAIGGDRD